MTVLPLLFFSLIGLITPTWLKSVDQPVWLNLVSYTYVAGHFLVTPVLLKLVGHTYVAEIGWSHLCG